MLEANIIENRLEEEKTRGREREILVVIFVTPSSSLLSSVFYLFVVLWEVT